MKMKFIGAAGRVTGSCTLLEYSRTGSNFLVDCGMVQGEPRDYEINRDPWPFVAANLNFVLLTHAHLDHCGLIPRLYKDGFRGSVICTRFTAELTRHNLADSARQPDSPYTVDDVAEIQFDCLDDREGFGFSRRLPIADDLFVSLLRSSHIGGACGITISWKDKKNEWSEIHFSGDVGNNTKGNCYQSLLSHRQTPFDYPRHLILESTYGDRTRDQEYASRENRIKKLSDIVRSALCERKGPLIIPCFSIHRTQEILFDLHVVLTKTLANDPFFAEEGSALFAEDSHIESTIRNGLRSSHVDGPKSLIGHWDSEKRAEWLSWFAYSESSTEGKTKRVLLPRDSNESTLAVVREKLRMLKKKQNRGCTVVMDSPLALKMCGVYKRELKRRQKKNTDEPMYRNRKIAEMLDLANEKEVDELFDRLMPDADGVTQFSTYELRIATDRKSQDRPKPAAGMIFLTGGGMCEGGPVLASLSSVLPDADATVLLTGYAPPKSTAGRLRSLPEMVDEVRQTEYLQYGAKTIQCSDIKATIADIGAYYSGHADQTALVDYVLELRAKEDAPRRATRVFLNHGDDRKRAALADAIQTRAKNTEETGQREISAVELPGDELRWFDLEADRWLELEHVPVDHQEDDTLKAILVEQRKTNQLLADLLQAISVVQYPDRIQ